MTDDRSFLQAIVAQPGDLALRRIYADWLEEQGDAASLSRAEYLRTECDLEELPARSRKRAPLKTRLSELQRAVGNDWWRELDYAKVGSCVQFQFACPQRWDTLQPTEDAAVRHCTHCQQHVYYCATENEALHRADLGQCVAIDARARSLGFSNLRRLQSNRDRGVRRTLGKVMPRAQQRIALAERGIPRRPPTRRTRRRADP